MWAPLNFDSFSTHFDVNELFDGKRWHETGFIAPIAGPEIAPPAEAMRSVDYEIAWRPGTRTAEWFELTMTPWVGEPTTIRLERWDLPVGNPTAFDRLHVQAIVRATTSGGIGEHEGIGILEQLALGRHDPTGLTGLLDGWKR